MESGKSNRDTVFWKKAGKSFPCILIVCLLTGIALVWKRTGRGTRRCRKKRGMVHIANGFYEAYIKRPLDFVLAASALVVLSPLMFIVAILVRAELGPPVFFQQERPGQDEKVFKLIKFRTMADKRDAKGELLPDQDRLTKFGKLLRNTSLDELPELFNIVKGDMSIVGPRPLLTEYLPRYSREQARRQEVRPGLTGLAQVSGRNGISWEEKFRLDVEYVDHITFLGDLKIVLNTVIAVLRRDGITSETSVTMEKFMGSGGIRG